METTDLADDPGQQVRLIRMQQELDTWMRSVVHSVNGGDYDGLNVRNEIHALETD